MSACPDELTIARWVDGELSVNEGEALDAHARGCGACRERAAHLRALEAAMPRTSEDAAFVGDVMRRVDGWDPKRSRWAFVVGGIVAASVALLVAWPRGGEWSARGGAGAGAGAGLEVAMRVEAEGVSARVIDHGVAPTWLMIFGLDEACEVHWLLPAWDDPESDPVGRRFAGEAPIVDLPEGLRMPPGRFLMVAAQSDSPRSVRAVEAVLGQCAVNRLAGLGLRTTTTPFGER